jgi:hypothetical protein
MQSIMAQKTNLQHATANPDLSHPIKTASANNPITFRRLSLRYREDANKKQREIHPPVQLYGKKMFISLLEKSYFAGAAETLWASGARTKRQKARLLDGNFQVDSRMHRRRRRRRRD